MGEKINKVDKSDNIRGGVDRCLAHSNDGIMHRGLFVIVKNSKNEIYIAERSVKRLDLKGYPAPFPNQWDVSIAGHPKFGETGYLERTLTELKEELNIDAKKSDLQWIGKFYYVSRDPLNLTTKHNYGVGVIENELCGTLLLYTNQEPIPNPNEVSKGEWIPANDLQTLMQKFIRNHVKFIDDEVQIRNFNPDEKMFTPWFAKAHLLYPEIYTDVKNNPKINKKEQFSKLMKSHAMLLIPWLPKAYMLYN
jgi:isopentenyl-diphosphate delta-isomerase